MLRKLKNPYMGIVILFFDEKEMLLVATHWQYEFNYNMVGCHNDIYRMQMPNITLHVCIVPIRRKGVFFVEK